MMFQRGMDSHTEDPHPLPLFQTCALVTTFLRLSLLVGKMGPVTFALSCGNDTKMKRINKVERGKKSKKC